ncbi:hypothetical protein ACA910_014962 [Epithemia clementina (nom. ined.)]
MTCLICTVQPNQVPLLFMIPLGVGMGLAVRMGHLIAAGDRLQAKSLAIGCALVISAIGVVVATTLYLWRRHVIAWLTKNAHVNSLALEIWPYFCLYMWLIHIMGISSSILRALGVQWRAAGITFGILYGVTLPAVWYAAVWNQGGLVMQWKVVAIAYVGLQMALVLGYARINWHELKVPLPPPPPPPLLQPPIHNSKNNNTLKELPQLKQCHENDNDSNDYNLFREDDDEDHV